VATLAVVLLWRLTAEIEADATHAWPVVREALAPAIITHADRLGGLALVLRFECDASRASEVRENLREAGLRVTRDVRPGAEGDWLGMLHVTLIHDGPDERVEIPDVPG